MDRRRFLGQSAAFAGSIALGGGTVRPALAAPAPAGQRPIRIGYIGRPCEAATFTAPGSIAFRRAGLAPHLVRFRGETELIRAIGAGTIDAASATLPALVTSLERGVDARVVAGLHAGCLRVVAPEAAESGAFADLRGKVIATDQLHGPAMNLFSALLRKNGIDPHTDVSWRVYQAGELEGALDANAVACVAAADPLGYLLLREKKAEPYLDAADGGFSCGDDIAHGHHCFFVLRGGLVRAHPMLAASITRAFLDTSHRLAQGVGPASLAEVQGGYIGADPYTTVGMLESYSWTAATEFVLEEIELTARDFRGAGLLAHSTDPQGLAESAFADVLHAENPS